MFRSFLLAAGILILLFLGFYLFKVTEFTDLQLALKTPEKVEFLNLSNQNLKTLPKELKSLPALEILWLQKNPVLDLASSCEVLISIPLLRAIVISENNVTDIPECLQNIHTLRVLDVSENPNLNVSRLIQIIENMPELEVLSMTSCNLTTLPPEIVKIKHLKKIYLMDNPLSAETQNALATLLPNSNLEF